MVGALAALCSQLLLRTGTVDALADVCLGIGRIRCRRIGKQRRICVERTAWCPWSQLGNRRSALLWLSVRIGLRLHPEQLVYRGIPGTGNVARGAGSLPGRLPLDLVHSVATVIFLSALYLPWKRKLERIKRKYALR